MAKPNRVAPRTPILTPKRPALPGIFHTLLVVIPLLLLMPSLSYGADGPTTDASTPSTMSPWLAQGIKDFRAENLEEAIDNLIKARQTTPTSTVAAYYLGITYKAAGKHESAILHLEDSLMLTPRIREAAFELGETYYQLGRFKEALDKLSLAAELGIKPASANFLSGLALARLGKTDLAVAAFTRAKELDPDVAQAADLQIGLALLQGKKQEEGERVLREVFVTDPNSELGRFAGDYLDSIKKREAAARPLKLAVHLDYSHDDNVILMPSDESAASGVTGESDEKSALNLSASYDVKLGDNRAVKFNYSAYYLQHANLASYDVVSHTMSVVPSRFTDKGFYKVSLSYNHTWVDDSDYMATSTIAPDYTFSPIEGHIAVVAVEYKIKELLQPPIGSDEDRDATAWGASVAWRYLFAENRGLVGLGYSYSAEDTDGVNWNNESHKASLTIASPFTEHTSVSASGEGIYQRYENIHTSFSKKRAELTYALSAVISYAYSDTIDIRPHYTYTMAESNIAVYDYEKNVYGLSIDGRF